MGLQSTFRNAAVTARKAAGDAFLRCSYGQSPERADYDAASGTPVWHNPPAPLSSIPAMFADYSAQERLTGGIPATDQRAYIAALDLAATPKIGDLIRKPDLTVYEVRAVRTDPVSALWDLQLTPYPAGWLWAT